MTYSANLNGVDMGGETIYRWRTTPTGMGHGTIAGSLITRAGVDGVFPLGTDTLPARIIAFDLYWVGDDAAAVERSGRTLAIAWTPQRSGTTNLTFTVADDELVCFGRPRLFEMDLSYASSGHGRARCEFEATDPRLFSSTTNSIVLGLVAGGGRTYPRTYPLTYGAGSDSDGVAVNAGTFETDWTATIVGPVTTPRITLGETGQLVELDGVVPSGSTLVVSSADGSVLLDGSPRPGWPTLVSRFFKLSAGSNTIRFRAASGTGSCTFSWRHAKL